LRAGDEAGAWALMDAVVALASPTGQWPEAIHPLTTGGCMGDGQHIWAAAEWLMLVRNLFVREEADTLMIGAGVRPEWLRAGAVDFGPTLTPHGMVSVHFVTEGPELRAEIDGAWRGQPPCRKLSVPGYHPFSAAVGDPAVQFMLTSQS